MLHRYYRVTYILGNICTTTLCEEGKVIDDAEHTVFEWGTLSELLLCTEANN